MKRCVAEYITAARRFEQLAQNEPRSEAKQLMKEQAETCIKLARKRATEADWASSQLPAPFDWIR